MRAKIAFVRNPSVTNVVPLHHQKLISGFVEYVTSDYRPRPQFYNFSSLKGTSKVKNGFMRFLSSKITLVVSSPDTNYIELMVQKIMGKDVINVGKMELKPKEYNIIDAPEFEIRTRYVCISPIVPLDPNQNEKGAQEILDPYSHKFSDILYNDILDKLERAGFTEDELYQFAEFEVMPDKEYMSKLLDTQKKYARFYKCNSGKPMVGYLFPFTLHAHVEVHKFIWDCGLGTLNKEGYGMVDIVKQEQPV